jgi:hypothetical protein
MTESRHCAEVRELIPELAMGVAPGDERAVALAHIAGCADCRQLLEETTETVDELLLLAPEHEPPTGFDSVVMAALDLEKEGRSRRWKASGLVLAAAVVLIAAASAAGITHWVGADDRELAAQYRETLRVADGSYLRAAPLVGSGNTEAGHVFAYEGNPSWVFVTVRDAPSGVHRVRYVTEDGRSHPLGVCTVRDGRGSWGTALDVPVYAVDRVELVQKGHTLTADFEAP